MYNLRIVLHMRGKTAEAETLDRGTLEICGRVLGPEHPDTLVSMSELSETLDDIHRYNEAETIYRQALAIGEPHSDAKKSAGPSRHRKRDANRATIQFVPLPRLVFQTPASLHCNCRRSFNSLKRCATCIRGAGSGTKRCRSNYRTVTVTTVECWIVPDAAVTVMV